MKSLWKDRCKRGLVLSLVLMLVSMIATSVIQSSGGQVEVKTLMLESITGHTMSAKLYIPPNATEETPAPAIVCAHGWYNNKENQDSFAVEFSRRGYVVLAYDMYSHGNSEELDNVRAYDGGNGMYDAVFYVSTLPYVNPDQITVSGHSAGANACSKAVVIDNENGTHLISACILMSYDPVVMDTSNGNSDTFGVNVGSNGNYNNIYGDRDVAVVAGRYDDYFFTVKDSSQPVTATRDYLSTSMAKAFVSFGQGPDAFAGNAVEEGKFYTQEIDGRSVIRVIYTPSTIHAQTWFSSGSMADCLTFMGAIYPTNSTLEVSDQVWQVKAAFGLVGLVGFWMSLAFFACCLLLARPFEALRADGPVVPRDTSDTAGKLWVFGSSVARTVVSFLVIFLVMSTSLYSRVDPIWKQKNTFCISVWAAINGAFTILVLIVWYYGYAKKRGVSLQKLGILPAKGTWLKTIAAALLTVIAAVAVVFFADFFFQTDFRFWQWSMKAFTAAKLPAMLPFLPLFLLFFVANSVVINIQSYNNTYGKSETVNLLINCFLNALAPLLIIVIQYVAFVSTGYQVWGAGYLARVPTWLHTAVPILFITPLIARKIYKETRNPYLGGIVNGLIVTLTMCLNSTTLQGTGL